MRNVNRAAISSLRSRPPSQSSFRTPHSNLPVVDLLFRAKPKTVTAYFSSKQLLSCGFAGQHTMQESWVNFPVWDM